MKLRCVKLVVAAVLTLTASEVCAQDGLEGALSHANLVSPANSFTQTLAVADFDGDNKPDGAVLVGFGARYQSSFRTIELHFTGRGNIDLVFESNESALAISALDVNGDGVTDIVVEQPFTHKRLQVWLNDGHGGFRKVRSEDFPSTDVGNQERLQSASPRLDCPTLSLPPQRGFEIALSAVSGLLYSASSSGKQALVFASAVEETRAAAPNSPRAPPLSHSL